ncbi:rab3 GTPase-activating protein catalytic subunit isoform X4 [Scyliorhinus torazame]|uniref:rab3 GTPase-activating protein catalytic subunit isoform X4 n=1 Tax=Scyliorhinus torazame TaxID=75743 RepID=UPI003B5929AE
MSLHQEAGLRPQCTANKQTDFKMAADSDPESEVFEITDFTTASEWERFVSKIEEVLNNWKLIGSTAKIPLEKGELTSGVWEEKSDEISFADYKFSITHHYLKQEALTDKEFKVESEEDALPEAMQDLLSMNNDFPPRAHCLVRWYGLREFVVISPAASSDAVISESKCNILLSSISIALGNTGCQVTLFVQIQQKSRRMYVGACEGPGVRTDFEMIHLRKVPNQYNHLSGLLDIFKSKIGCPLTPLPPISVAIRFTYVLQDWQQYSWPQQPPDFDALVGGEVGGLEFGKLPFGACEDPISELHLATTWPHLTEGIIVDNDVYSDLDALQAPQWSVRVRKADNPQCLLGDFLTEFFKLCRRKESTDELLGRSAFEDESKENADISQALQKLTEPTAVHMPRLSTMSNMVHSARKRIHRHRRVEESPISNEVLNSILLFLFPDAVADAFNAKRSASRGSNIATFEEEGYSLYSQFKSAPSDSLTYKLALCLCMVNFYHGGMRGVAHLWQEFVLEMRYRLENNYLVPGLATGPPDLKCCLLHQKLQMLNCCIERKKARDDGRKQATENALGGSMERKASNSKGTPECSDNKEFVKENKGEPSQQKSWESWSDSEDEFFECLSDTEELKDSEMKEGTAKGEGKDGGKKETQKWRPEGRLHQHGKLTLLRTGDPLYIPVTQEPAPMTEDLLEEQSEVLAKLGTSAEGAHLRARMQSACLLSDMESFKAANPGCCLEDFVRWYSPRDYIEEEVTDEAGDKVIRKELSARMKIPGNMWVEAWETAKPIPARRQRRLFDDTREAEKVLHYLVGLKPADLTRHLLPCILHAALLKVKEEESIEDIPSVRKIIQHIITHASKLLRYSNPDIKKLEEIINQIIASEAIIARSRSLQAKFGIKKCEKEEEREELERFVSSLLEEPEVPVIGAGRGPTGSIIYKLFVNAQRAATLTPIEDESGKPVSSDEHRSSSGALSEFPPPTGREIILRTTVPRPAPYSKSLPQRMYCVMLKDDFRLAGAFSSDTSFF